MREPTYAGAVAAAGVPADGPYTVAFVYLHDGTPFAKKGDRQMTLPKMEVPISVVEWELFVPDRYRVDRFSGTAVSAELAGYRMTAEEDELKSAATSTAAETVTVMGYANMWRRDAKSSGKT